MLTGVAPGYDATEPPPYRLAAEPDPATDLPLQPGCEVDGTPLAPPVRLWALADATSDPTTTSIASACADDYAPSLQSLLPGVAEGLRPICMPVCVADVDDAPGLQVSCELLAQWPADGGTLDELVLPRCEGELSAPRIPGEALGCWLPRTGDERRAACRDGGWNLEVELVWDGAFPPAGIIKPTCNGSNDRTTDCPDLR
jgi:hypothetical protein